MSLALPMQPVMTIRRTRRLPILGEVLVQAGEAVTADTIVAQAEIVGVEIPVEVSRKLGIPPSFVERIMVKQIGDLVEARDYLAVNVGLFGLSRERVKAPCTGYVESISKQTGIVTLRTPTVSVQRKAYLPGRVVEVLPREGVVVETCGVALTGAFGVGGERSGRLRLAVSQPDQVLTPDLISSEMSGTIVVGGGSVTAAALKKAADLRVAAIIAGSIHDSALAEYLGYELGVPITGQEDIVTALILTEGFGETAMRQAAFDLLQQHAGRIVSANGTTHLRSNLVRPEVVIPAELSE